MNLLYMAAAGVVIAAVAGGAGYWRGDAAGSARIQQQWDAERAEQLAAYAQAQAAAREKEQLLLEGAEALRKEKDREIRNINARAAALSNILRDRAERLAADSSGVSSAAAACGGASGAQLARGDGEFLAGYAADAARLQSALDQCLAQYEQVRGK